MDTGWVFLSSVELRRTWDWVPQVSQIRTPLLRDQEDEKQMGQASCAACIFATAHFMGIGRVNEEFGVRRMVEWKL